MSEGCVFCDQSWMREAEIFIETPHCIFVSSRDPDIRAGAGLAEGVLPGSGAIVPIAHRTSVFELTPAEWADTRDLLLQAQMALHDLLAQTAICWAGTRALACIPTCTSSHDSTTSRCLTAGCARRSKFRKTDGPIHGRPGADGHFGKPGERGPGPVFNAQLGWFPYPTTRLPTTYEYLPVRWSAVRVLRGHRSAE